MHGGLNVKAIVVAVSVLVAACGGGGADKAATTGDTQPGEETTTVPPGGDGEGQADGGDVGAAGGASAGGTATTKPGAVASSGSSGGTSSGSGGSGGGSTATTTPGKGGSAVAAGKSAKAGRYTFNRTGTRKLPGNFGDQSLNGPGTLTVDPPTGSDQRTFLSYNQYDSTEQTVRYRADGIDLLALKLETQAGTFDFRPSPPVLFAPDPVNVGATWAWKMTSTDNRLTLDSTFKVVRTESQSIGGESVATAVVEGTINVSGVLTGTIRQTLWASERYRMIVRLDETSDLNGITSQSSSVLASTTPA